MDRKKYVTRFSQRNNNFTGFNNLTLYYVINLCKLQQFFMLIASDGSP